ncbi:IclR family transcriptional regulator domain-containing protein [Parendozoicomonas haliclonae]|uniref:Transcriptional regulator KdgR n=1 Tax=Parendozoicomonas haliclonae TaxID=1960125 RepID=A0A1X7AGA1_9GAMM|nr:IclR family transcriptional regulator C-terminal domain-containing protein [Parendozoicomonas haliclonae]SMA39567.1 Transcriptional regulator KdgR [Parendozoicomonas haliclonae]
MDNSSLVSAVVRLFSILEKMSDDGEIGVSDLAQELELPKATVHRFVKTLENLGYVRQFPESEHYTLTMKLFELSSRVTESLDLVSIADPYMRGLADLTGETVHLAVFDEASIVYLHKIPSRHALQLVSRVGRRAPLHCTAIGKAIVSSWSDHQMRDLLKAIEFQRFTEHTITTPEGWRQELDTVRARSYAIDDQEHELSVRCFAVPVFDQTNKSVAGISISIPVFRINEELMPEVISQLCKAGECVSREMGCSLDFGSSCKEL